MGAKVSKPAKKNSTSEAANPQVDNKAVAAPAPSPVPAPPTSTENASHSHATDSGAGQAGSGAKKMPFPSDIPAGVVTGDNLRKLLKYAHENHFAIPAFNCTSTSTINAVLEAARDAKSSVIIQFSQGGAQFLAGKGLANDKQQASIAGAVAGAHFVRQIAPLYGIPVIVHSDHCAKKLLPWFDGMLEADEAYFKQHGEPLFSSHMLDLSEEPKDHNIQTCLKYLERLAPINCLLEMEIGVTGGEEDGVNNENVENSALYTQPDDIWDIYSAFSKITDLFTIAAAFGNVHGVYAPGNVKLHPELLGKHQEHVAQKLGKAATEQPVWFVFHGGSGSTSEEIKTAVKNGVVKMNIDTDTQWAYWEGLKDFYESKKGYLQGQIGNPDGPTKPNKKFYDPRVWVREAEKSMGKRCTVAFNELGSAGTLA
ncbi:fructose-bisphosphate aldolase, class II [Cladochytrium replicatum]|nr:fructose-bisphosphate aldolase, class II [Cladochytrium replicatum]